MLELEDQDGNKRDLESKPELIHNFFKEEDSIKEDQILNITRIALSYLDNEVIIYLNFISNIFFLKNNIQFNELTLKIVELIKKMIFFECLSPYKMKSKQEKYKNKLIDSNDFYLVIKALVNLLEMDEIVEANFQNFSGKFPTKNFYEPISLTNKTKKIVNDKIDNSKEIPFDEGLILNIDKNFNKFNLF